MSREKWDAFFRGKKRAYSTPDGDYAKTPVKDLKWVWEPTAWQPRRGGWGSSPTTRPSGCALLVGALLVGLFAAFVLPALIVGLS